MRDCQFACRVGELTEERAFTQAIILDIEFGLDLRPAAQTDDLAQTVNYLEAHDFLREHFVGQEYVLIETLAEKVTQLLFERFLMVQQIKFVLKKPGPLLPRGGAWAGVQITRSRGDYAQ